jgi:hypothetical protein
MMRTHMGFYNGLLKHDTVLYQPIDYFQSPL